MALLRNGFPSESVNNGSVIAVKTHEYGPEVRAKFEAAILIVRSALQQINIIITMSFIYLYPGALTTSFKNSIYNLKSE